MHEFIHEVTPVHHSRWRMGVKRGIDICVSTIVLLFIWPLLLGIAVIIAFSFSGPVFYRGVRGGFKGGSFRILKFRTMVRDAELMGGPTTGTNDPRVTGIGKVLRWSKLNELPQFINVILGDMSLVGPRPEVLEYTRQYKGEEQKILSMRPGITDFASIEFADLDDRVGNVDPDHYFRKHIMPRKNMLRVKYVTEWSLGLDFKILGNTCLRVWKRVLG